MLTLLVAIGVFAAVVILEVELSAVSLCLGLKMCTYSLKYIDLSELPEIYLIIIYALSLLYNNLIFPRFQPAWILMSLFNINTLELNISIRCFVVTT